MFPLVFSYTHNLSGMESGVKHYFVEAGVFYSLSAFLSSTAYKQKGKCV